MVSVVTCREVSYRLTVPSVPTPKFDALSAIGLIRDSATDLDQGSV